MQRRATVASLLKAASLAPTSAAPNPFLANLAGASAAADQQIRTVLRRFVLAHPESPEAHLDYALLLGKLNGASDASSLAETEGQLRSAIELDPALAAAQFQLGLLYAKAGDDRQAIPALEAAVRLQPQDAKARYRLALAYRRQKRIDASEREMAAFRRLHAQASPPKAAAPDDAAMRLLGTSTASPPCPAPR